MSRSVSPDIVVHYPCSDDQPMAESEFQLVPMLYVLTVLRTHFRGREDVYVGGDMFVYYEEGNSRAVVAPDVFVVIGAPKRAEHPRDTYKLWEEPKGPDFVLEVLSSRTWKADLGSKRALYASLGVTEYWLFDPTREHLLSPPLRGMRLAGREYRELPVLQLATSALTLRSEVLGLDLLLNRGALFFRDPATGEDLLGHEEERYARQAAEVRVRRETAARETAEVRAEQADAVRRAAETRARREAAAREAAEAQIAELQARLRDLQRGSTTPRAGSS